MERHEKSARYITVTLPLHYRYITVTPAQESALAVDFECITVTSPLHHRYITITLHAYLALGGGCLSRGRCGENPRVHRTAPSDGSGEPARAWSLAWDMVVADPCNGFQPG